MEQWTERTKDPLGYSRWEGKKAWVRCTHVGPLLFFPSPAEPSLHGAVWRSREHLSSPANDMMSVTLSSVVGADGRWCVGGYGYDGTQVQVLVSAAKAAKDARAAKPASGGGSSSGGGVTAGGAGGSSSAGGASSSAVTATAAASAGAAASAKPSGTCLS